MIGNSTPDNTRMNETTVPTGSNGRSPDGKFGPGNRFAKGNPLAKKAAQLRSALLKAMNATDVKEIINAMKARAKSGDTAAAKLVLAYTVGEPIALDILERLENLEVAAAGRKS
jgi:hypothetical protein